MGCQFSKSKLAKAENLNGNQARGTRSLMETVERLKNRFKEDDRFTN